MLPDEEYSCYRARSTCQFRVEELTRLLTGNGSTELPSLLTVMNVSRDRYVVLDGNHRYGAMQQLRLLNQTWFTFVLCTVYKGLSKRQALALSFHRNSEAENILQMSDFNKVSIIRRYFIHYTCITPYFKRAKDLGDNKCDPTTMNEAQKKQAVDTMLQNVFATVLLSNLVLEICTVCAFWLLLESGTGDMVMGMLSR